MKFHTTDLPAKNYSSFITRKLVENFNISRFFWHLEGNTQLSNQADRCIERFWIAGKF